MNTVVQQQTTLASLRHQSPEQQPHYNISLTDSQGFELAQRVAKMLASSQLVPEEYRNNIPNCVIALNMAHRVRADPLQVMQNLVVVQGRPTWSSQFLIATVNSSGKFSALRYTFFGEPDTDSWGCRAWAVEKSTDEKLVGTDVTIAMAKLEGWYDKKGSKWKTMPQQMLKYRAASWWTRAYAPELSIGLHTAEEVHDIVNMNDDGTVSSVTSESLRPMRRAKPVAEASPDAPDATAPTVAPAAASNPETGEVPPPPAPRPAPRPRSTEPTADEQAAIHAAEMQEEAARLAALNPLTKPRMPRSAPTPMNID